MISPDVSMRGNKTQKKNTHHQFKVNFKYDMVVVVVGEEGVGV